MKNRLRVPILWAPASALGIVCILHAPACSEEKKSDGGGGSPFASFEAAANSPGKFVGPRAGVPIPGERVAFIAEVKGSGVAEDDENGALGDRFGVMTGPEPGKAGELRVLYVGDKLVNPYDIELSTDEKTLYVADLAAGADGRGSILSLPLEGGEPTPLAEGYLPRGVTAGPDGTIYFTGNDPSSQMPGLFTLKDGTATVVVTGPPFVDPSGIAVLKSGTVLVADTSLGDGPDLELDSRAGIVQVKGGVASVLITGFKTGYPAGIAVTTDEKTLIVSGLADDRSDAVYLYSLEKPEEAPTIFQDQIGVNRDSSAGLKRAHKTNTFVWASLEANGGGTAFLIRGK